MGFAIKCDGCGAYRDMTAQDYNEKSVSVEVPFGDFILSFDVDRVPAEAEAQGLAQAQSRGDDLSALFARGPVPAPKKVRAQLCGPCLQNAVREAGIALTKWERVDEVSA